MNYDEFRAYIDVCFHEFEKSCGCEIWWNRLIGEICILMMFISIYENHGGEIISNREIRELVPGKSSPEMGVNLYAQYRHEMNWNLCCICTNYMFYKNNVGWRNGPMFNGIEMRSASEMMSSMCIISFTPTKWEIYNHNQQSSWKRTWGYYGGLVTNNGII